MNDQITQERKPHAVFISFPAQGHVGPMMILAKLLHRRGFHITFVNTEFNHQRLINSRGPDSVKGLPDFRFETIPDGLPLPADLNATQDIPSLFHSIRNYMMLPFLNLIKKLNNKSNLSSFSSDDKIPPVTCIVSDGVISFPLKVGKELGIPVVLFWTASACGLMGYLSFPQLVQRGLVPLKDESYLTNGYLDTKVDWLPGMKDIRFRDLPSFVRTMDQSNIMFDFFVGELAGIKEATALILNTFDTLEMDVLDGLKSDQLSLLPLFSVGPIHQLLHHNDKIIAETMKNNPGLKTTMMSIGSSLWKEETECLKWLDSKKPNSVVYVNFGSITVMTTQQLIEFAWGLANSKHDFLWVVRADIVKGDTATLPVEFVEETKDRGLLASWCPQEDVLKHPSIGVFLTHSGWNSTIESITGGVPVICWPFFAEQQTNCRYSCVHWGIGMEIDNNVKRDEVEKLVREMMRGEKGKEMKNRAVEWKKKAEDAISLGGSSFNSLSDIVNELLQIDSHKQGSVQKAVK
ncbi:7-deoxyloganetin glucosyltransferase-like isoform X2 [Papaver somniferum]|uniref:7-deoxyloganetin glucosyltransferase-like isoform X2 n=1 Tax=Papaver somniferum TaxID=3469 RepID=UPI000E702ACF|nr:7-deoxyloganetin glucosyltransferase-like isoform X2 [Papaver somniferum]